MRVSRDRAEVLLQQGRPELAEPELRRALTEEPHDPDLHAVLALCLLDLDRPKEALAEAEAAIALAPDEGFGHYARSRALLELDRPAEAEAAIRAALDDNPFHPTYWGALASIEMVRRRWTQALAAADAGLALDPEHVVCNNLRASALVHLGRRDEAGATLSATLARNPGVAHTHANQGWALLHRGEVPQAMEHFREALRLEPGHDWARAGLVEAMKARNPVYGLLLRYFLWMSRLPTGTQWLVMVGGLVGYRVVLSAVQRTPGLQWLAWPVILGWAGFVYLTWTATDLFNVVLLLDPMGRHALTRRERLHAAIVGGAFAVLLAFVVAVIATGAALVPTAGATLTALATLPLAGALRRSGWRRMVLGGAAAAVAGLGAAAWAAFTFGEPGANEFFSAALTVGVASTWLAGLLPNK